MHKSGKQTVAGKALPEIPAVEWELNGLDSEKGPTPYLILIPTPTQVTQKYHRRYKIIGQRHGVWVKSFLLKLLCLLLYQISVAKTCFRAG